MGPNVQSGKNGMGSNVHGTNCLAPMFQTRAQYMAVLLVFFIRNASVKPVNLPNDRLIGIFSFFGKFTSLNLKAE